MTKHEGADEGKAHASEGKVEVKNLFRRGASGNKLRATGGAFTSVLFLGAPINDSLIEQVNDTSDRSTIWEIMTKVGVNACCGDDGTAERMGKVIPWSRR